MEEFLLTVHAAQMAWERGIKEEWIRIVLREPCLTIRDDRDEKLPTCFEEFLRTATTC